MFLEEFSAFYALFSPFRFRAEILERTHSFFFFGHPKAMKNMIRCGICGWCLEIAWTGFLSFRRRDPKLKGQSSLWMFPIYGMAAFIRPLSRVIRKWSFFARGILYTCCIFGTEYLSGSILKKHGSCPWDYSDSPFHINGLIRLDYAPLWFTTGLLYEKLLR